MKTGVAIARKTEIIRASSKLILQKKHEDQNLVNNLSQDFLVCYGMVKNYFYGLPSEALPIKFKNTGFFSRILSIFQK